MSFCCVVVFCVVLVSCSVRSRGVQVLAGTKSTLNRCAPMDMIGTIGTHFHCRYMQYIYIHICNIYVCIYIYIYIYIYITYISLSLYIYIYIYKIVTLSNRANMCYDDLAGGTYSSVQVLVCACLIPSKQLLIVCLLAVWLFLCVCLFVLV